MAERPARAAIVGSIVAALITLPGLGAGTLWDNSETAYGEVAREVLSSHDWLVMHLNGAAWFVQPPLYFWIAAVFSMLLKIGPLALRLPSALATIAMGGMTAYAVSRQAGTRVGIFASVILSTSLMQAVVGRLAIMDALLDLAVALAVFWWFRALQTGRDRYFVYGWVAAAFGFLAKGPVAPVVALLVIGVYALWNRRSEPTPLPTWRGWLVGLGAFAVIVVPWFAAIYATQGGHALVVMIGHYTIGRYTGVIENQAGPWWYYLPVAIVGFFPWIAFLPVALWWAIRGLRLATPTPEIARLVRLAIVWTVVPLLFFSFAKTKLPNYIALELPALALAVGLYFDHVARRGVNRAAVISAASVPIFIGLVAVAIGIFVRDNKFASAESALLPVLVGLGATIFTGAIVSALLLARDRFAAIAPYGLGVAMFVAIDVLALVGLPKAEAFKPIPSLAAAIDAQRRPGDIVAIQSTSGSNSLLFYTAPKVYVLAAPDVTQSRGEMLARNVICSAARVFVVAPAKRPPVDPTYGRTRRVVARSGRDLAFLYTGPRCGAR
ncbi:MAG TPA: glycosyltransferase family 39 protein [Candidatus Baltobacteraceae bacterium]